MHIPNALTAAQWVPVQAWDPENRRGAVCGPALLPSAAAAAHRAPVDGGGNAVNKHSCDQDGLLLLGFVVRTPDGTQIRVKNQSNSR